MADEKLKELLDKISKSGYGYYDNKRPSFEEQLERERFRALNCTDSRIEELRNRAKHKLIIRELKKRAEEQIKE